MRTYNPSRLLISIHLPKCGGTSLMAALEAWFGDKLHYHYYNEKENALPSRMESYKIRLASFFSSGYCVHGHFNKHRGFGIRDYYPGSRQFITFLRDPLEIYLSNYYFVNKNAPYRNGERYHLNKDINTYLEDVIRNATSWYMTHFPDDVDKLTVADYIESRFVFIGVMEEYQKSLDILAEILNRPRFEIPAYNKTERDPHALDDDLVDEFKKVFDLDYRFYNYARQYIQSF
jgi:hypothetical protein